MLADNRLWDLVSAPRNVGTLEGAGGVVGPHRETYYVQSTNQPTNQGATWLLHMLVERPGPTIAPLLIY